MWLLIAPPGLVAVSVHGDNATKVLSRVLGTEHLINITLHYYY